MILLFLFSLGCSGKDEDSTAEAVSCADLDGTQGGDTGNIPDLLGSWTTSFAQEFYENDCSVDGFEKDQQQSWIGSIQVDGRAPDALYMYFGAASESGDEKFWGAVDRSGGVTFAGTHVDSAGTVHAQFGGLAYNDAVYLQRDVIDGGAFLGLDPDNDGDIDCHARGSWKATKSGQ